MAPPHVLRFVQFSDIHFGQERPDALPLHNDVREEVIRDCRRVRADGTVGGPADAILITGDIAYGGKEAEYQNAGDWLDKVAEAIGCGPRDVRMIPGNHDVDWSKLGAAGNSLQRYLRSLGTEECERHLVEALAEANSPLMAKLDGYLSFAEAYGCSFTNPQKPYHEKTYPLAGGKSLRVVGLCSVLISDGSDRHDAMMLGRTQYTIPRDDAVEPVVMVHHPIEWFKDAQLAKLYLQQRARLLLTGHEHLPEITKKETNEFEHLHLAAGAMNPPATSSIHNFTYNWIEFSWEEHSGDNYLAVRVVPRAWNSAMTRFDPDYSRTGGPAYRKIKLKCGPALVANGDAAASCAAGSASLQSPSGDTLKTIEVELSSPAMESETIPSTILGLEGAMTHDASSGPEARDEDAINLLRFLFWRHLDRGTRQEILYSLDLLPKSDRPVPHVFETAAFNRALHESAKLQALWEAAMSAMPEAHRQPNPFIREV